jgi:hypothetical protein
MADQKVFDFNERRKQSIEQKRRQFERVVFEEFLGVDAVIDDNGSGHPVKLLDVSADGLQFQVPFGPNTAQQFKAGTDLTLKLTFSKGTYLPVVVKVRHAKEFVDSKGDVYWRCGTEFDKTLPSFKAMESFIEFIYQYAEFSCRDNVAHKVYFL